MPVRSEQPESELVDHLERTLDRFLRLQRVDVGEARQPRDLLVEARVVLHRAAAERKQAKVDRIILAAEAGVVADGLRLGQAGEADRARARKTRQPIVGGRIDRVEIDAGLVR